MTHFTVAIIIPPRVNDIDAFIVHQMDPFSENTEVEPYVCYTPEQAAADIASSIHRLELIISRNEDGYDIDKCRQNLDELRSTTPEQRYQERSKTYETFNESGEPLSTYNPDSKWDWYVIGGRWDGWINDLETSRERIDDNIASTREAIERNKIPHAIITPDGEWHERGQMGWWGTLLTENENWDEQARCIFAGFPDERVVVVDAHI
ncbi:hypothetical protein RAS1_13620 [Phycisphaerae bacterium RAS1]|nr:hypothetical protein RAS1_13620 [Phycisphaerae bacterium RAS1]